MPSEKALKVVDKPFSAMVPPVNKNISAETKQTVDDTSFESSEIWTAMRDCVGKRVTEMTKVEKMLCTEPLQVADIAVMQSGKNEKVSLIDDQNLVVKENNDSIASQYHSDENINKLCTNLSYTSISDDTLLRLGCSLDYVYNEQTGEVVDNSEVIGSANIIPENDQNFEINGWEKIRDELEQEKEELLKCDESLAKHVITSTCSNDEVGVSEIRSSTIKTEENYTDSKAIKSPNIRCIVQQTKILESIEEEEGNTTTTFNKSKDLFDSTLSGSQLFSDKSQSSVCLQNTLEEYPCSSSESPGFRSPLHKILKPGSPLITVNNEIVLDKNINKKSTGDEKENGEFEIINVCESEALWKQFEVQRKSWNQIGLAIAVDSKDVVGVALCALFNKCFYIDLTQNFESAIGIGRRLEALYVILKSNQQKCLYDFQSFARVLRYLSLAESQNLQFNHCICIQTLSYMAHYRMDNDEYPLSFQDLVMQLSSPERAVILQSSTPRINAVVSAFVCLHMYDDLMSAAVRLSSIESVELELQSAMLFAEMESVGLLFDKHKAENMKTEIKQKLTEIETKAYHIAGIPFNFNSAAEISKILFVRLGIPPPNESTSRHYSTGKSVLKPLARHYPIANLILKWRQINIALTTSLPKLLKSCSSVGRIHPQFVIHCSTGRVLTAHPNVQNVQKNEIISGYSIRSLFIAPNGRILISSDYCQLELRILAHLSADPKLISIFSIAGDFFEIMAERWNADQAVDVNRDKVKQLCYGIIYGMGASSLSKELGISRQQAQIMIISFFQQFPKVRIWMDKMLAACRSDGFVSTMLGRRRFLPHITSVLQTEKAQAERQVINTCIQGSAAELFKIALLKLQKNLRGTNSFIIMQLHDEILVEADEDSLPSVANIVEHSMTSVITGFRVPLAVKISAGGNWGKLQKYARN
ncbi:unnamed protein product [Thelazia callipaeda]|uniref:DNA-directed DNA polymerase n=1 Tax=Thelazia callipaeda TaxID=103827 RepID=A0A158RB48_THECL|nr:unnamed protein product [Thelazia callipaeda]